MKPRKCLVIYGTSDFVPIFVRPKHLQCKRAEKRTSRHYFHFSHKSLCPQKKSKVMKRRIWKLEGVEHEESAVPLIMCRNTLIISLTMPFVEPGTRHFKPSSVGVAVVELQTTLSVGRRGTLHSYAWGCPLLAGAWQAVSPLDKRRN